MWDTYELRNMTIMLKEKQNYEMVITPIHLLFITIVILIYIYVTY